MSEQKPRIRISFDQLKRPKEPGTYSCEGVGRIMVSEYWSAFIWDRYQGDALLDCEEVRVMKSETKEYYVVSVVPIAGPPNALGVFKR